MRTAGLALSLAFALWSGEASAGAWTLGSGQAQILPAVTYSFATSAFDARGMPDVPVSYQKILSQIHAEYGWNDYLTLILSPEWATAQLARTTTPLQRGEDYAVESGARLRLWQGPGVFSLQMTAKTAGAFTTSTSVGGAGSQEIELRGSFGDSFQIFHHSCYIDAEVGQRFVFGRRADEVPIDLTAGLYATPRTQVIVQSFNLIAEGDAKPPYRYFRYHKLAFSVIRPLWRRLKLETSSYVVLAGQSALAERGMTIRLWAEF